MGNEVFLKLRPYRQKSLAKKRCEKLSPKFYGPYRMLERIGQVAYRLELPREATIHNVFHASQLNKKVGERQVVQIHPPQLTQEFEFQVRPEDILGVRWNSKLSKEEWLIKWEKFPESKATWEEAAFIKYQFPELHLEDKVHLKTGGIVRPPIHYTYQQKNKKGGEQA